MVVCVLSRSALSNWPRWDAGCQCGSVNKKPLSLRVHHCERSGVRVQWALYSAYLVRCVDPDTYLLYAEQARQDWPGAWSAAAGGVAAASYLRSLHPADRR